MSRFRILVLSLGLGAIAMADTYGRYTTSVEYVTDASDGVTGVYFQMVAEQGSSKMAYAVIGGVYPIRASSVSGDIVIPETLEGVPVRKIADGAFVAKWSLTSVRLPANLREIGDRAFADCRGLTNVTFAGTGVASLGDSCFSNCMSLASLTFPDSLQYLAPNVFVQCDNLQTVTFEGNAPRLDDPSRDTQVDYFGEKRWTGGTAPKRVKFRIKNGTYGWRGPYLRGVPDRWPLSHGFMSAHLVEAWGPTTTGFSIHLANNED